MDTQLNAQELEKVLSCISIEIMKIDLNRDSSKPSLRQMILYSARDKLLKQQKTVKGEEVRC